MGRERVDWSFQIFSEIVWMHVLFTFCITMMSNLPDWSLSPEVSKHERPVVTNSY